MQRAYRKEFTNFSTTKKENDMDFLTAHKMEIVSILFFTSELLGSLDFFKSSSVFELVKNGINALYGKKN